MTNAELERLPVMTWHIVFLGKIYSFIGWLGLIGAVFLFLSLPGTNPNPQPMANGEFFGLSDIIPPFLLVCWSILLLNFSKDITGSRKWTTGIGGWCIGILNLLSVPIGTAIGTYTLWVLFKYTRMDSGNAASS